MKDPWQKSPTPYETLKLDQAASPDDVKKAFKAAFGGKISPRTLAEASKILQDPLERAMVDILLYPDEAITAVDAALLADATPLLSQRADYYLRFHNYLVQEFGDSVRLHALTVYLYWTVEAIEEGKLATIGGKTPDDRAVAPFNTEEIWKYLIACWSALQTDEFYLADLVKRYPGLTVEALMARLENYLVNRINHWAESYKQQNATADYQRLVSLEAALRAETSGARHLAAARVGFRDSKNQYHRGHYGRLMLDRIKAIDKFRTLLDSMLHDKPGDPLLRELLDELSTSAELINLLKNHQYDKVIETIRGYPADAQADCDILKILTQACLEKGKLLLEQGQWSEAFTLWEEAHEKLGVEKELARNLETAVAEAVSPKVAGLIQSDPDQAHQLLSLAEDHDLLTGRLRDQLADLLSNEAIREINNLTAANSADSKLAPSTRIKKLQASLKKLKKAVSLGSAKAKENLPLAEKILESFKAEQNGSKIKASLDKADALAKAGSYSQAITLLDSLRPNISEAEKPQLDQLIASVYNSWGVSELNRIQSELSKSLEQRDKQEPSTLVVTLFQYIKEVVTAKGYLQKAHDLNKTNQTISNNLQAAVNLESQLYAAISQQGSGSTGRSPAKSPTPKTRPPKPARSSRGSRGTSYSGKKTAGNSHGCLIFFIIVVLVVAGISVGNAIIRKQKEKPISELISQVATFATINAEFTGEGYPIASPTRYFLVQNKDTDKNLDESSEYSELYFELPEEMRATTPDNLNTLVQIERHQDSVGHYTDGAVALQWNYDVTVIDYVTSEVVASEQFTGSQPPATKSHSGSASGSKPTSEVVEYLKDLAQ